MGQVQLDGMLSCFEKGLASFKVFVILGLYESPALRLEDTQIPCVHTLGMKHSVKTHTHTQPHRHSVNICTHMRTHTQMHANTYKL